MQQNSVDAVSIRGFRLVNARSHFEKDTISKTTVVHTLTVEPKQDLSGPGSDASSVNAEKEANLVRANRWLASFHLSLLLI